MSLILDALKKLEKDRVTRRKRSVHIASDILLSGKPESSRKIRILIAAAGIAFTAVALTLVFMNPFSTRAPGPEQATIQAPPPSPDGPTRPAGASPVPGQVTTSSPKHRTAAAKQQARKVTDRIPRTDATSSVTISEPRIVPRRSPEKMLVSDSTPLPVFTVTGIVWAENRSSRRAMVNGEIVGEGGNVGGVNVTEIHQDHVRFSHKGRNFNVYVK